ncbi:N-acetylglucosamine-6-phosphate deacetylase [Hyella patelloides LEGE 07179]|uniref:N-acetylglucosamine-6-phosphate deacetylase n=1 Tax=Hyella patelloides LEGE 07179 TaxID=945734 RepID=A0A563W569_9CYAN|nr:N-acetylglucosamine-6-phosphate deacetylase [Hyella patelloides]VEP18816.1 N-acetylglucosamine-6-phosphate deacetylase [Hyella patelloides LEGE 07179]
MNQRQIICNAQIPGYQGLQNIVIDRQNIIEQITDKKIEIQPQDSVLDITGDYISLGGVDLQINGGLGLAFPDLEITDIPKLKEICDYLWQQGVDAFLPTIVTTSIDKIQRSLYAIQSFIKQQSNSELTAKILGVHLEGPFLNYAKRGAHPEQYLLPLTIDLLKQVIGDYQHLVKIITLAPELDSTGKAIKYLKEHNIIISLGHSLATETEAEKAFKLGASMITHSFNAMPSLHHRQPGLLGAAIVNNSVYCGLIADGKHVSPTMIKVLLNSSSNPNKIFLVSDALAPIGLSDGVYPWDSRTITVKDGTASLPDGTLSGTTLPLLTAVQNLVRWDICSPQKAIALATESPRKAINLPGIATGHRLSRSRLTGLRLLTNGAYKLLNRIQETAPPKPAVTVGQSANLLRWNYQPDIKGLTWERICSVTLVR